LIHLAISRRAGYLRNTEKAKDAAIVRRLEHASFMTGIEDAFAQLAKKKLLTHIDVLNTHKVLFEAVYPWAGQAAPPRRPTSLWAGVTFSSLIPNSSTTPSSTR
jgi:fido (protein-threonine AMPylation protein)